MPRPDSGCDKQLPITGTRLVQKMRAFPGRLLLVGCGNMAGAMLSRWIGAGLDPAQVAIVDPTPPADAGVATYADLVAWQAADGQADWILLGMKPQQLGEVADTLAPLASGETRLLSILAGVPLTDLTARFPTAKSHTRILPNLPARIGMGVSAVTSVGSDAADDALVDGLLEPLGQVLRLAEDSQMDLITAFTGSGPAFVLRLIEAYAAGGERLGLSATEALALATATFGGTSALLAQSGDVPGALIAQVASKGGTTQAGLDVLDADGKLAGHMTEVLRAARDRGRELAELARGAD